MIKSDGTCAFDYLGYGLSGEYISVSRSNSGGNITVTFTAIQSCKLRVSQVSSDATWSTTVTAVTLSANESYSVYIGSASSSGRVVTGQVI